jgi:GNAT superfamily N-acetyltransferase
MAERPPRRWRVRPAAPADADALVGLIRQFSLEEGGRQSPLAAAELVALTCASPPRFFAQVAELGDALVGYAAYFPSYDTDHAAKGFYLQDLYVQPPARGQGIGRALMAAVARACLAEGGQYLFWNALQSNQAGRAFYRHLGAREEPVVTLSLLAEPLRTLAAEAG